MQNPLVDIFCINTLGDFLLDCVDKANRKHFHFISCQTNLENLESTHMKKRWIPSTDFWKRQHKLDFKFFSSILVTSDPLTERHANPSSTTIWIQLTSGPPTLHDLLDISNFLQVFDPHSPFTHIPFPSKLMVQRVSTSLFCCLDSTSFRFKFALEGSMRQLSTKVSGRVASTAHGDIEPLDARFQVRLEPADGDYM